MIPLLNWSETVAYRSLFAYVFTMTFLCVPVVILLKRFFAMVWNGAGHGVCRGNKRTVVFAIFGVLFWGFWSSCALEGYDFAFALWRDLWQSHESHKYLFQEVCLMLAYVTPMVTTAYFAVLLFHRISNLLKRRKVADRT